MTKTSRWFREHPSLNTQVARFLKNKFPTEDFEVLYSEVGYWFSLWGKRGTCDDYIEAGKPPTPAILTVWVGQKVGHRLYKEGKDALLRERKGVRTQFEVRSRPEEGDKFMHPDTLKGDSSQIRIVRSGNRDRTPTPSDTPEGYIMVEPSASVEEVMEEADRISFVQDLVRVKRAKAADRYARFCDHLLRGRSKEETALLEGVSQLRVTHMYQRVRNDLKDAPLLMEVALRLLEAVADEPWSTTSELEDTLNQSDRETTHALNFLVIRGLVRKGSGESFAPTNLGLKALREKSLI